MGPRRRSSRCYRHWYLPFAALACLAPHVHAQTPANSPAADVWRSINAAVAQITIGQSTLDDVTRIFGEPDAFVWDDKTFSRDNLPSPVFAVYDQGMDVMIYNRRVEEIRFSAPSQYRFRNRIAIGARLDEVFAVLGKPERVVTGKPNAKEDEVLYLDVDGQKGWARYTRYDDGVHFFFENEKVTRIFLLGSLAKAEVPAADPTMGPVERVRPFDDLRDRDLSRLDLSQSSRLVATLTFNQKTVWPPRERLPEGFDPARLLEAAKNPGLGVRALHRRGITGKGVNVAIIDQALLPGHPEYKDKLAAYHETGPQGKKSSMHGPAVASLLVGEHCGTAPGARLYYAAAQSIPPDAKFYAAGLEWILAQSAALPAGQRIRVVSVSAGPSGVGSLFMNGALWEQACARAAKAGILVIDCTESPRGFIGHCSLDADRPETPAACKPGPLQERVGLLRLVVNRKPDPTTLLVPTCLRTVAELYEENKPGYQYDCAGGLSWGIPYAAGVLAMGWQVRPDLQADEMKRLLFESACVDKAGNRIINPGAFIIAVEHAPKATATKPGP